MCYKGRVMKVHTSLVLGLAAVLLPGCVTWNTGKRIQESEVTYTGVDVSRPVGGLLYESRSDVGFYYMQAPEVTYRERTPMVQVPWLDIGTEVAATQIKDTGKIRWVRRKSQEAAIKKGICPAQVLESPPDDLVVARVLSEPSPVPSAKEMGASEVRHEAGYAKTRLVSMPCQYVVDPLLSVASTAASVPLIGVGGSVYGIWTLFSSPVKKTARALLPDSSDGDGTPMPEAPVIMP